jgi:hypothetical protein
MMVALKNGNSVYIKYSLDIIIKLIATIFHKGTPVIPTATIGINIVDNIEIIVKNTEVSPKILRIFPIVILNDSLYSSMLIFSGKVSFNFSILFFNSSF